MNSGSSIGPVSSGREDLWRDDRKRTRELAEFPLQVGKVFISVKHKTLERAILMASNSLMDEDSFEG
jgi:hypothetical protein